MVAILPSNFSKARLCFSSENPIGGAGQIRSTLGPEESDDDGDEPHDQEVSGLIESLPA